MKLLLIVSAAVALSAAIGCSAPQSEPHMAKIVERRTSDNTLQIAELQRRLEDQNLYSAALQQQVSYLQQEQFLLQKKLCEKDRALCSIINEQ